LPCEALAKKGRRFALNEVMMVKENGKWQAVTSRHEEKIKSYQKCQAGSKKTP